ncbi:MAG: PD40 domain-containing protein [Flavobacteriales bacterium]|nr:PD40 domain-containing protein [Flavobacteriales bacterium]MBP9079741.1 PD40 domain-containing protein [Flavobacteriales bacterium]
MINAIRLLLLHGLLLVPGVVALGQGRADTHTRLADRYYARMAYAQAKAEYRIAADLGAVNEHVVKRLADCSMKLGDTRDGELWYAQVVKYLNRAPIDLYMYAQALKGNGKYAEAETWMDRYLAMSPKEGEPGQSNIVDFAAKFAANPDRFTVKRVSVNTPLDDMAATWDGPERVVFCSTKDSSIGVQRRAAWNDQPFLDLFTAKRQPDGDLIDARPVRGNVNSRLHDGPAVVAPDGSLWYTRTNAAKGQNGVHRLAIMHAQRDGEGWKGADPFLYNNPECSVGHPAISADGRWFFFISDMPGGYGGTDLYLCENRGGQWGEPRNLGPGVNTPRNELFPFMAADGTLYFASAGPPGLGGLDIFASRAGEHGEFAFSVNVGAPVNSSKDDFAFVIDPAGKTGYFTSDRPGGPGGDDLFAFTMHYALEQRYLCTGTVIDDDNALPVAGVAVELLDAGGAVVESTVSDTLGRYSFPVKENMAYAVRARMQGRYDGLVHLSTEHIKQAQILVRDVHLVPDAGIWLRGVVRHKDQLGFVEGVKVSVVNLTSFFSEVHLSEDGGDFLFRMQPNEQFEVVLEKPDLFTISVPVSTMGMQRGVLDLGEVADLAMEPVQLGRYLPLKHVKWTEGTGNLPPSALAELDQVAERVQVNPSLKFELAVHMDTRLAPDAAMKLAQARATAIADYLRTKGIRGDQMAVKAYGITKPLVPCGPGVECTAGEHQRNERVEYAVTAISGS